MADHFAMDGFAARDWKSMRTEIDAARERIQALCPAFELIRDVADASKHAKLATQKNVPRQLSSADQVSASSGLFGAPFGCGVFAEGAEVTATLDDGATKALMPAVRAVLAAWKSMI
ncbi:MAG: hypothetical protein DI603_10180 [Roseateles depolymerans]|uniref:Uncharacterized protein n=1 Tax=Roseateles depolymerans TaxID=76731 RepID=A0A2W5DKY0_9BURK|nr:MAG: hypothetical protein DI603_10180 [Roseateles depolymerans]